MRRVSVAACLVIACCSPSTPLESASTDDSGRAQQRTESIVGSCPADLFPGTSVEYTLATDACDGRLEKCIKDCELGDANACHSGAYSAQKQDNERHEILFLKSCSMGISSGCTNAAAGLFNDADRIASDCVARSFQVACDADDTWGCTMSAALLATGNGVDRDWQRAHDMMLDVCAIEGDESEPCNYGMGVVEGASFIKDR